VISQQTSRSNPTVDTALPRAQKCSRVKFLSFPHNRAIAMALFPFRTPGPPSGASRSPLKRMKRERWTLGCTIVEVREPTRKSCHDRLAELRVLTSVLICAAASSAADRQISFSKDIQPVFQATCWKCHSLAVQSSGLDLSSRESALKGGEGGVVLVPGNAAKSRMYRMAAGLDKPAMPLGGKLKAEDIEAIRLWIDQGAVWDGAAKPLIT
jgi:hypothetical protein